MKTTIAFYLGEIREEDKYLQTYKFKDGYAVEEKGVSFNPTEEFIKKQKKRFDDDKTLFRIDIEEPDQKTITITR